MLVDLLHSLISGQIIATSHVVSPQKVAGERKSPAISGKSRLVKYYDLARCYVSIVSQHWCHSFSSNVEITPLPLTGLQCHVSQKSPMASLSSIPIGTELQANLFQADTDMSYIYTYRINKCYRRVYSLTPYLQNKITKRR